MVALLLPSLEELVDVSFVLVDEVREVLALAFLLVHLHILLDEGQIVFLFILDEFLFGTPIVGADISIDLVKHFLDFLGLGTEWIRTILLGGDLTLKPLLHLLYGL